MSRRGQAWNEFTAARSQERALHGTAETHRQAHGAYPDEYLAARQATAAAWGRYLDAPLSYAEPEPEAGA
jgi:hypothetical protein